MSMSDLRDQPERALGESPVTAATPAQGGAVAGRTKPSPRVAGAQEWKLPGFAPEARVLTTIGELPIKLLRRNDEIVTPSGQPCAIEWIDRVGLDPGFLRVVPGAAPVVLRAGALGADLPERDLWMSRQQMVVKDGRIEDQQAAHEICEEAAWEEGAITYTMFHCGRPVLARVDGLWCRVDEISARKGRRAV